MFRKSIFAATATVAMALSGAMAHAADEVSIRLNWYLVGFHTPFFLGVERGFYKEEGIELTINEGRGSVVAAQAVGAGSDTFGVLDGGTVVVSAAKGLPIKAIMTLQNVSPYGVVAPIASGIKSAKDLEGKTVAVTAGDSLTQLFPAVIRANDLDESKIKQLFIDAQGKVVAVMENRADALLGARGAQDAQLKQRGVENVFLPFWEMGVPTIGLTITAHTDMIEKNPDLVQRFVRATIKSFEAARHEPEAAVEAGLKAKQDQNRDVLLAQLKGDIQQLHSSATEGKSVGYGDTEVWANTVQLMKQYAGAETDKPATAFYTNEFVEAAGQ